MSMYERFIKDCGAAPFSFELTPVRKVGANYIFKYGKYKGKSILEVIMLDKKYVKNMLESGDIAFTKKDDVMLRKVLYAEDKEFGGMV